LVQYSKVSANAPQTPALDAPAKARAGYKRSNETKARILEAALAEACEVGFLKTSVARVAARAGVAIGVLNYHFGSKRELMRRVMQSVHRDLWEQMIFAVPAGSDDFFEQERAGLLAYIAYVRANPAHVRLAEELRIHDPELAALGVATWLEQFQMRTRAGIERGRIPPMDDAEIRTQGYFVLGAYSIFDRLLQADSYPGDRAVADAFLGLLRGGLGGHATRPASLDPCAPPISPGDPKA